MRIMNNLIVGLNGGVNRVTSARVVEGIGAYSNPFRPAPFSAKPCDCVEGTVKNHCVSQNQESATVPPVSVNTGSNLPKESAKSEVSLREEITETLGCERHHSPNFTRYLSNSILFIIIILVPVWAGFGLPGWVAWICTVAFLAGLRQANRDYDLLVSPSTTRYKSKTVSKANASCVEVVADTANSVTGSHAVTKDKRRAEKFFSYNSLLSHFSPGASLSVSHKNYRGIGNGALL